MQAAKILWWKDVVPGRELAAVDLYKETSALCQKAVDDGVATDYAWFVGEPSTSYLIIRGEFESLMPFVASPEYQAIALKAGMVNTDFSSGWFFTGEAVDGVMGRYGELASQLA